MVDLTAEQRQLAKIVHDDAYNQFKSGPYGVQAIVGSAAIIQLPTGKAVNDGKDERLWLEFMDAEGHTFRTMIQRLP